MNVGEQKTITATVNPSDATEQNLSWQSMDKDIVNVNNGRVAALKNRCRISHCFRNGRLKHSSNLHYHSRNPCFIY